MSEYKTLENLATAFAGESMARNRYTIYASIARKEGYQQIGDLFLATADNEFEHAEWNIRMLNEVMKKTGKHIDPKLGGEAPHVVGNTAENLAAAIAGENYERTKMYPEFAEVADKEGFHNVATRLKLIAKAETHHEERYAKLLGQITAGTFFKKSEKVKWTCIKCGYIHEGLTPPAKCPLCEHDKSYYMLLNEEY
jgi:rubrerythrin